MTEREAFGAELQRTRERRGLSLDALAECTKISGSLFAGLERGDVSRWPSGIFRRAFVRSYAQAVGLDPEDTVARFLRLYPDADGMAVAAAEPEQAEAAGESAPPRLVLDEADCGPMPTVRWRAARRIGAPVVDLLIAGIPACIVGVLFGWQWFWIVAAGVGLVGHLLVLSLAGATPGAWLLLPRRGPGVMAAGGNVLARRRAEPEAAVVLPARRRQPRHAAGARPVATARSRRIQH